MIFGLDTGQALPEDHIALEAIAVIKCLDEHGDPCLVMRSTTSLSSWESVGMLAAAHATTLQDLTDGFEPEERDDSDK